MHTTIDMKNWMGEEKPILYVVGSQSKYRYDGDFLDWLYLAMRWLIVVRAGDAIALPDFFDMREYVSFLTHALGYKLDIIWIPVSHSYLMDEVIAANTDIFTHVRAFVEAGYIVLPYAASDAFHAWYDRLPSATFCGESQAWAQQFGSKAILHPRAVSPHKKSLAQIHNVPVLPGFVATGPAELMTAYQLLLEMNITDVILKPANGSFGVGITPFVGTTQAAVFGALSQYTASHGPIVLEQYVEPDVDELGREKSWSVAFHRSKLFAPTRQYVRGRSWAGNTTPYFHLHREEELRTRVGSLVRAISPDGVGGFDGLLVNGRPFIIDVNTARTPASLTALIFQEQIGAPAMANYCTGAPRMGIFQAWDTLVRAGIAFDPITGRGVLPQGWIPNGFSQLISLARTGKIAESHLVLAAELLGLPGIHV